MYFVLFAFAYLFSLIPLRLLYILSSCCNFILFYLIGYRKQIVRQNLEASFPELNAEGLQKLIRSFNRSFCDQWVETLKLMSMPVSQIQKRMQGNWDAFDTAAAVGNGKVIALLGHQFNWELGNLATPLHFQGLYAGIYLPVNAKAFDRLMLYIRKRTGALLIPANELRQGFRQLTNQKYILAFMADQTPASLKIADWHLFLHRPAPFFNGPEKVARRQQAAVVFVGLRKTGRGQYQLRVEQVCANAKELPEGMITKQYVSFLERELKAQPANWMWTHRRWKRKLPEGMDFG